MQTQWADFRWLYLVDDTLHVGFVGLVSIQERGPLVRGNAQPCFHGYLNNLGIVFPSQSFVSAKLLLQLHQGGILIPLGHLARRIKEDIIQLQIQLRRISPGLCQVQGKWRLQSFSQTKINYDTTQWTPVPTKVTHPFIEWNLYKMDTKHCLLGLWFTCWSKSHTS